MSIKKQYLKSKPVCKVTFRLPEDTAGSAESANIVGEFNDWNIYATPMRKLKNGSFTVTIDLENRTKNISFVICWMMKSGKMMEKLISMYHIHTGMVKIP